MMVVGCFIFGRWLFVMIYDAIKYVLKSSEPRVHLLGYTFSQCADEHLSTLS